TNLRILADELADTYLRYLQTYLQLLCMLLEQQEATSVQYLIQHFNREIPTVIDHSCTICYPTPQTVTIQFRNFWNWLETYYRAETFTLYTVQALPIYCAAFQNDSNSTKPPQVVDLALKILLSISYFVRPDVLEDLVYYFLNFTFRTNYFNNPVTPELINTFNADLVTANNYPLSNYQAPPNNPLLNNPPVNQNNNANMNEGQMKDLMKLVWGADPINNTNPRNVGDLLENTLNNNTTAITNALQNNLNAINALTTANQNRTTSKVVDVPFFYGRDDEDPYEWCRLFEAAFAANGWPDNRKIALAAGFLKEAARDWYEEDRGNINQWHIDNNADNFDTRLINYFATAARRNQWTRELQNIKQGDNESVENYSQRFKKLLNKATQGEALAARYQINYYINGLKSFLVGQVVIGNTDTLEATITRAKLVEL
ncbi:17466_t:CDS:2, partial [Rhizophagus irregularis]